MRPSLQITKKHLCDTFSGIVSISSTVVFWWQVQYKFWKRFKKYMKILSLNPKILFLPLTYWQPRWRPASVATAGRTWRRRKSEGGDPNPENSANWTTMQTLDCSAAHTWRAGERWRGCYLARWICAFSMTASHASSGCRSFSLGR